MPKMRTNPVWIGLVWAAALTAPAVRADILDDILSIVTAARDRATEARNNAASARDRAIEARNNAATARDTAIEMRNTMQEGLNVLTDQIRAAIADAVEDLQQGIEEERAGMDAFVADGGCSLAVCQPFRQDLVRFLRLTESTINTLYDIADLNATEADFGTLITLVETLPGRALYPLYRTIGVETNIFAPGGFVDRLAEVNQQLQLIAHVLDEGQSDGEPAGDVLDQELSDCEFVLAHLAEIKRATSILGKFGLAATVVGKGLSAAGETQIHKQGAVWGWAGVSLQNNRPKKIGIVIEGLGSAIDSATTFAGIKLRHCAGVGIASEARDRQNEILANQERILKLLTNPTGDRP